MNEPMNTPMNMPTNTSDERQTPRVLKTLSRRDADFTSYLDGSFSDELVAIPLRSLNVGTQTEEVTFHIVKRGEVSTPSALRIGAALIRPSTLILSAGPMIAVFARAREQGRPVDLWLSLFCFLGVVLFQIATNLLNDYGDHMKGQDRLRPQGGSRAIQNGWIDARKVRQIALGVLGVAILLGVPAVIQSPTILVAAFALLFTMEFGFQRLRLKARGWAEGLAFLLTGPLLTSAFIWAVSGTLRVSDFTLGAIYGSIALLYFHSSNFENIMVDSQAGARTWATRAGFDSSKLFYYFVCGASLLASAGDFYLTRDLVVFAVFAIQLINFYFEMNRVHGLRSPLASDLIGLRTAPLRLAWTVTALFLIGSQLAVRVS